MPKWIPRSAMLAVALIVTATFSLRGSTPSTAEAADAAPPPVPVKVAEAVLRPMAALVLVPGTVVSRNDARIAAEISGRLTWVAEIGDPVAAGDPVARIDAKALDLQIQQDEATIRRLETNLEYLDKQLERLRTLTDERIAARHQLDEILAERAMAEQELVQAGIAGEQTRYRLERTEVRAPFPGKVVERLQQPGGYVSVGRDVVRLVNTRDAEVRAQAPLDLAPYLRDGMEVTVGDDVREIASRIRTVVPVGDERSRMFELRVALPADSWAVGSAVRVELPRGGVREAVSVSRDALILRRDSAYLFKVTAAGTVERVAVETGVGSGVMIEIRGEVAAGDRVVVRGGERLQPGQAVAIQADG